MAHDEEQIYEPLIQFITGSPTTVLATYWFVFCLVVIRLIFFVLEKTIPTEFCIISCDQSFARDNALCGCPELLRAQASANLYPLFCFGV